VNRMCWSSSAPSRITGRGPRGKWLKDKPLAAAAVLSASTIAAVVGAAILMQLESDSLGHFLFRM
jgi:hypothetical protein